jgi:hypothetical protein
MPRCCMLRPTDPVRSSGRLAAVYIMVSNSSMRVFSVFLFVTTLRDIWQDMLSYGFLRVFDCVLTDNRKQHLDSLHRTILHFT